MSFGWLYFFILVQNWRIYVVLANNKKYITGITKSKVLDKLTETGQL